jgi:hypothetical protein
MENKGFDLELGYRDNFGDLGFSAKADVTHYKNKIVSIAEGYDYFDYGGGTTRIGAAHRNIVGEEMSSFFGYRYLGLFTSQTDVDNHAEQTGAAPGFLKFDDTDNDGTITPEDRVIIGSPHPDFTYGLNLDLSYKGFDLNAYFYGSQGNEIFNWNLWWIDFWASFQGQKGKRLLYESWTPERPDATVPKASNTANFSTSEQVNGYYIEDGSFLKLKTLQLGYTLPQSVTSKINVGSLRVYVQAVNLFTLTKYSGLDPELGGDDRAFGSDTGNYPNVKQVIFGLNLTL